eukprot:1484483-Lingulodinium_polyedra.AAC.1
MISSRQKSQDNHLCKHQRARAFALGAFGRALLALAFRDALDTLAFHGSALLALNLAFEGLRLTFHICAFAKL